MLSLERYWQNMIDREMVEEENKDEKIRHENSSGCMHGNYVYQSVSTDGIGGKEKGKQMCIRDSSNTVPFALASNLSEEIKENSYRCCLAGFGAGLCWGAALLELGDLDFCEMTISNL